MREEVYEGKMQATPAELATDESLKRLQDKWQGFPNLPDLVKDSIFYI